MERNRDMPESNSPAVSSTTGLQVLRRQRKRGEQLLAKRPFPVESYRTWEAEIRDQVTAIFGAEADYGQVLDVEPDDAGALPADEQGTEPRSITRLEQQLEQLDRLIKLLETEVAFVAAESSGQERESIGRSVILVYGYDPTWRETVVRFLEACGLSVRRAQMPSDPPSTIVEAFVEYTDILFAVMLLTADERGRPPRARQDAVLDLGFLLGRLGRKRVCALYEDDIELPAPKAGILYIKLDDTGAWQHRLLTELQAVGAVVAADTV